MPTSKHRHLFSHFEKIFYVIILKYIFCQPLHYKFSVAKYCKNICYILIIDNKINYLYKHKLIYFNNLE